MTDCLTVLTPIIFLTLMLIFMLTWVSKQDLFNIIMALKNLPYAVFNHKKESELKAKATFGIVKVGWMFSWFT